MQDYSDLPLIWQHEIKSGSAFGQRVVAAMEKNPKRNSGVIHKQLPSVSTFGTELQSAIELAGAFKLSCGHCLAYLRSLNQTTEHDAKSIEETLMLELQIPPDVRQQLGNVSGVRIWLREIIESIMVPTT